MMGYYTMCKTSIFKVIFLILENNIQWKNTDSEVNTKIKTIMGNVYSVFTMYQVKDLSFSFLNNLTKQVLEVTFLQKNCGTK